MKKMLFLFVFCGMTSLGFSQMEQASKPFKLGIHFNASQVHLVDFYEWRDFFCFEGCGVTGFAPGHSFAIGITSSLSLNEHLELITGLEYTQKSYYEEGFNFFSQYRLRQNLKHLQIPSLLRYKFFSTETKKVQAYFDLGFNTLINLNQEQDEFAYESTLKNVSLNAQSGLGLVINFEKISFAIGPQFSYAITNFGAKGHEEGFEQNKLRPYEIGLGIRIFR